MPEISVIVPVYNAEKYLKRCIYSILAQLYQEIELILVDDGSTDSCPEICDAYAQTDARIRVIHQKNKGQAAARNTGLEVAAGKYILFCDADDKYDSEQLNCFLDNILRNSKEERVLNCFDFRNVWPNHIETVGRYHAAKMHFRCQEERVFFLSSDSAHSIIGYSVWNKLYSKRMIDKYHIRFLEREALGNKDDWAEDLGFNLQYCMCVDEIGVEETPIYLLSKHGGPDEQTEEGLVERVGHMLRLLSHLQKTDVYKTGKIEFWQIAIWHLRRYFYLNAGVHGVEKLRKTCQDSGCASLLSEWITDALENWTSMQNRWSETDSKDYRNLLQYLKTGNFMRFKLQSYWLWKIHPKMIKLLRE